MKKVQWRWNAMSLWQDDTRYCSKMIRHYLKMKENRAETIEFTENSLDYVTKGFTTKFGRNPPCFQSRTSRLSIEVAALCSSAVLRGIASVQCNMHRAAWTLVCVSDGLVLHKMDLSFCHMHMRELRGQNALEFLKMKYIRNVVSLIDFIHDDSSRASSLIA